LSNDTRIDPFDRDDYIVSKSKVNMETSQKIREHKTISQQDKINHQLERRLEDMKLDKLKATLQAKMEPQLHEKLSA
jgi:hypothetical protein